MYVGSHIRYVRQQRQSVHLRHVDVGQHHIDFVVLVKGFERLHSILRKHELVAPRANGPPHPLQYQRLQVGLVVDHQYPVWP